MKVRFAPSPTGFMHIGNARVAIINYLFCQQNQGHFLFRIDDTDKQRSKMEYEDAIKRDLKWLGINWDSFFRQSERMNRYYEVLAQLHQQGIIYKCYETPEELEFKRKKSILKGIPPVYDREALTLSDQQQRELEQQGKKPYWRFKLPDKNIMWNDLVLGQVNYELKNISDPVITKSDGTFLYSFCSIIDDLDSGITHILRGQDHVTNTSAQIAMMEAITKQSCDIQFAHFSLLTNKDGSQFSKRLGSMNLHDIKQNGIDPMAICDLLATLGTSKSTLPLDNMQDLVKYFDITSFSTNSPKFNLDDLFLINKKIIRKRTVEEINNSLNINLTSDQINIIRNNVDNYNDYIMWNNILTVGYKPDVIIPDTDSDVIKEFINQLESCNCIKLTIEEAKSILKKVGITTDKKGKNLYMPIQLAILGINHGPHLWDSLTLFDIKELLSRLFNVLK